MHWPSDKDAKVDWFMGWNGGEENKHRPFFHHNRILQLGTFSPPPLFSSARFLNRLFRNDELTLWFYVSGCRTRGQERDHA